MITINNSNKPPKWVIYAMLILLVLLVCSLYRGCKQFNHDESHVLNSKRRIDQLVRDSIENKKQLDENKIQIEFLDGQIALSENKDDLYLDSFRTLNNHITELKKRYRAVTPSEDTTVTLVPNAYIVDCADCFTSIDKAQQLGLRYKAQLDNADYLNKSKVKALDNRISLLEKQNAKLGKDYRSLIDSVSVAPPSLRRTLFVTVGTMSVNQSFPNAIGGGFLYEDKKRRIFGAKYYISKYGSIYQGEVSFPLSLKFK